MSSHATVLLHDIRCGVLTHVFGEHTPWLQHTETMNSPQGQLKHSMEWRTKIKTTIITLYTRPSGHQFLCLQWWTTGCSLGMMPVPSIPFYAQECGGRLCQFCLWFQPAECSIVSEFPIGYLWDKFQRWFKKKKSTSTLPCTSTLQLEVSNNQVKLLFWGESSKF